MLALSSPLQQVWIPCVSKARPLLLRERAQSLARLPPAAALRATPGRVGGACSGAAAGLALQHALQFFCVHTRLVLETGSSAARAIMNRKGIGKLRHLDVKTL